MRVVEKHPFSPPLPPFPPSQEEERERRMDYVPDQSAINTETIEVGGEGGRGAGGGGHWVNVFGAPILLRCFPPEKLFRLPVRSDAFGCSEAKGCRRRGGWPGQPKGAVAA